MPDREQQGGRTLEEQARGTAPPLIRYPVRLIASLTGYGITIFVVWWQITVNFHGLAPDLAIWDRVGDEVVRGISPYAVEGRSWTEFFFYAPPWAFVFALTSWLPAVAQAGILMAVEIVSLRYIAGSWLRVGYFGLIPITGAELGNGSLNLVVAAAILAAVRGDGRLAAFCTLAKVSPILAIQDFRRSALVLVIAGLLTLPVWSWWFEWVDLLLWTNANFQIGYQVWWPGRVALAIGLVLWLRRPWARALAAAVAVPALYSYSLVLLYPAIVEFLRRSRSAREGAGAPARVEPAPSLPSIAS